MEDIREIEDGISGKNPTVKECLAVLANDQKKNDSAKEQLHRDWDKYVFRYIQDQVDRNMDALSVDDIMNKNSMYFFQSNAWSSCSPLPKKKKCLIDDAIH